jgi:hypothetical protein
MAISRNAHEKTRSELLSSQTRSGPDAAARHSFGIYWGFGWTLDIVGRFAPTIKRKPSAGGKDALAGLFRPENRLDAKLALLLNQDANDREIAFRPHVMAELALDRGERAFDVAPAVIVLHVLVRLELEIVKRFWKAPPAAPVWFDSNAMNACPPMFATCSKFSSEAYALSADTSPIVKLSRVSATSGTNCGLSAASLSSIRTAVTMFVFTPHAIWVFTHTHFFLVTPYF